ncbi:MAG TPA: DUF4337 family protein [Bryobacteraceae bacterium]|nr:DUF4337 family protein [Bryobacteraceae bacterium]
MAELEIHHEVEHTDEFGKTVGVLAAVLAVLLAIVTIISHRAHTDAVLVKSEANDAWSYYQSKRIKFHSLELGEDLLNAMPSRNEVAAKTLEHYASEKKRYAKDSETAQDQAKDKDKEAARIEDRALRYDFGEGLLEIGLVLTSLYFISRSKLFPTIGIIAAVAGVVAASLGLLM